MITKKYRIADKVVEICSIYDEVHEYCSDYLTDDQADYTVTTTQADIDFEREKSAREDEIEGIPTRHFSDSYLEELAVYRKIAEKMISYDTILFSRLCCGGGRCRLFVHGEIRHGKVYAYKAVA